MEMNEQFYKNTYLKEFTSEVIRCEKTKKGYAVVLNDTIFYPEGGGQPCDLGTINGVKVTDVRRENDIVVHYVTEEIPVGSEVRMCIDWARRFDHMQQHSAEHMVSGLMHRHYGYENVGFHMGEDVITIDFDGELSWEQALAIEEEANALVMRNEEIRITYPSDAELAQLEYRSKKELTGTVRIVTIPNGDVCACCGTHAARTGEIGLIKLLSLVKHKSDVRIEMTAGTRAYMYMRGVFEQNMRISHLLSAPMTATSDSVDALLKESTVKEQRYRDLVTANLQKKLSEIESGQELVIDFEPSLDNLQLRRFCNDVIEKRNCATCAVLFEKENGFAYIIISNTLPLRSLSKEMNAKLNGRGGGNDEMIQGTFQSDAETIRRVLTEMLSH